VGHEIDVSLCDLAADVRALTPSEAAERIAPSRDEVLETLSSSQQRIQSIVGSKLRELDSKLAGLMHRRVIEQPERMLDVSVQKLDEIDYRLTQGIDRLIEKRQFEFDKLASRLEAISPLKTLARGYSLAIETNQGSIISGVDQVKPGDRLETRVSDGSIFSQIERVVRKETLQS
jgi:exodeoxyribonuclease VII large subunit